MSSHLIKLIEKEREKIESPANSPPNFSSFGLENIPWEHKKFKCGEYKEKIQRIRNITSKLFNNGKGIETRKFASLTISEYE